MRELQFVKQREAEWAAWAHWLDATSVSGRPRPPQGRGAQAAPPDAALLADLPHAFRRLSHDLALARDRQYSNLLQERLRVLVLAVHQRIYSARKREGGALLQFVLRDFPALVRRERRLVAVSALLFCVPLAVILLALQFYPDGVYLLIPPNAVHALEDMYAPAAQHLGQERAVSGEWRMWGFYIAHNVKLDFQSFAGGIAFGLGAVMFLIYNGLFIGAAAGHLTQIGYAETFWSFVAGHSAFELTGAVLAGAAGLKLGQALVAPGVLSRASALKAHARVAIRLLLGAALLTFLAAFIEAFWSAERAIPAEVKYGVGILFWSLTLAYLGFAGRARNAA